MAIPGLLSPEEREIIVDKVADFILTQPASLNAILNNYHATRVAIGPTPRDYGFNVIFYCEHSAWVEDPALIIQLLKRWQVFPPIGSIIGRLQSIKMPTYHKGPPRETSLLAVTLPFIGREKTRLAVDGFLEARRTAAGNNSPRILIVNGPTKSGKTYTFNYINYINSVYTTNRFRTIYIDHNTYVGCRFGAAELVESILKVVRASRDDLPDLLTGIPELSAQQQARLNIQLVKFLTKQIVSANNYLQQDNLLWFIVLDRFDVANVSREIIEFIQLLGSIATGETSSESKDVIRLVLLGFKEPISRFQEGCMSEDIAPITKVDLETYFRRFCQFKEVTPDSAAIDLMVNGVLQNDLGEVPTRTAELAKWALKIAETI